MSDHFWRRFSYYVGILPIGALFGLAIYMATVEIKDLDLWLHLAVGKFITLHHIIPRVDILTCTHQGTPWINHEWLFQVIVYNIFDRWGPEGLQNMQAGIVGVTLLLLLFLGYSKEKQLSTTLILLLTYLIYQQRFTIRPDIYSLFFFTVYIFILALHIDKKWSWVVLVVVQIFWSNMHGFFFFGPVFVALGLISEWIRRHLRLPYEWNESGCLSDAEYQRLKKILLYVILASLVNPQFVRGAWYPVSVFFSLSGENKIFFDYIMELQKPITQETIFLHDNFVYYKLMILVSFVTFVFNRYRIDISALLFWLVFLFFSWKAARNVAFFGLAGYLVCVTNLLSISYADIIPIRFTAPKFQYITSAVVKLLLLLWIFQYFQTVSLQASYDFDKYEYKREFGGIALRSFPHKAADFLVANNIEGNFFNDFNSGAYLLGRCYPQIKVFIDGRTELYGGQFFEKYRKIWEEGNAELFEEMAQAHNITGIFLNSIQQQIPKEILNYLYSHKEWVLVYFNFDAAIFLKDNSQYKEIIDKYAIDLAQWEPKTLDLLKIGPDRVSSYQNYSRAFSLESLGFDEAALQELQEALKIEPTAAKVYQLIGKIYAKRKEFRKAFEYFRQAAALFPDNKEIRHNLVLSYLDMGAYEEAVKQYQTIIRLWPNDPKGYFFLAKAHAYTKKHDELVKILKMGLKLNPFNAIDVLAIGDILLEEKQLPQAQEIYTLALTTNRELAKIHEKLGDVAQRLGQHPEAQREYKAALLINPKNEEVQKKLEGLQKIEHYDNRVKPLQR